jgi:hypothetical protein
MALFYQPAEIKAQTPPDSCLKMMWPDSTWIEIDPDLGSMYNRGYVNSDSIKIDSCIGSPTYGMKYAKGFFAVGFKKYPFANAIPKDSIYTSNIIIDNHTKVQIQNLETKFGIFKFLRQFEDIEYPDSVFYNVGYVYIALNNYICVDSLINYLENTVDSVVGVQLEYTAQKYNGKFTNLPDDIGLIPNIYKSDINLNWKLERAYYQPTKWYEPFNTNFQPLGFHTSIYEMNLPLAWEISKGKNSVIAIYDGFGRRSKHPDVFPNLIKLSIVNTDSDPEELPKRKYYHSSLLGIGHGLAVASNACGIGDNGYPLIGSCPECKFIITREDYEGNSINAYKYDVDGKNGLYTYPDITTHSMFSHSDDGIDMAKGILAFEAVGNDRSKDGKTEDAVTGVSNYKIYYPSFDYLENGKVFICDNGSDISKDYKQLNVGATMSGEIYNHNCELFNRNTIKNPDSKGANYSRQIQFRDSWNFSLGNEKFNNNPNVNLRMQAKRNAFVDLVAPGTAVLVAQECNPLQRDATGPCDYQYTIGSPQWFNCKLEINCITSIPEDLDNIMSNPTGTFCGLPNRDLKDRINCAIIDAQKYGIWHGTSHSTPYVAGIAGLMTSLNKFMGVELNAPLAQGGKPVDGSQVQRNAYNILTFTAKKIPDFKNFFSNKFKWDVNDPIEYSYSEQTLDSKAIQYEYKVQYNDQLKRTWAQRVGFGLVNAYRAVAHSIRQLGDYEYSIPNNLTLNFADNDGTGDSRGYITPDAVPKRLMLWGDKVKEGSRLFEIGIWRGPTNGMDVSPYSVLEYGGVSLPSEIHNNQGVTRINNEDNGNKESEIKRIITVPEDCILAIDGIVISDQPKAYHLVSTAGSETHSSKILIEGLIQDVEVIGNLRVGDLILNSTINDPTKGMPGCLMFGTDNAQNPTYTSEVYGIINVKNFGYIYSWGKAIFRPGAKIELNGTMDFVLNGYSKIDMEHASEITGIEGRKIEVKDNSILTIKENSVVELNLEVNVKSGATLNIENKAYAKIKKLNIEKGGNVNIAPDGVLALGEQEHICNGKLYVAGSDCHRAKIVGRIKENCLPSDDAEYAGFTNIETTPVIYMKGDCADPTTLNQLKLVQAELRDVSINAYNVSIVDQISNCIFSSATKKSNPFFNLSYLLSLRYDNCQECSALSYKNVVMNNCYFKDYSMPTPPPNDPYNLNKNEYRTGGFIVENYDNVAISTSHFANLEYGIGSYNCSQVTIDHSTFDSCGIGDYDYSSNTKLCSNVYNVVKYGSFRDHSRIGYVFDNNYNINRVCYSAVSSDEQRFRGNLFLDYLQGISSSCTPLILNSKYENGLAKIYGKNSFNSFPYLEKNFVYKRCEFDLFSTDINLNKSCCSLQLNCGLNKFSDFSTFHIRYNGPGFFPPIDMSYNAFPPLYTPRLFQVTSSNSTNYSMYESDNGYYCCDDKIVTDNHIYCPPILNLQNYSNPIVPMIDKNDDNPKATSKVTEDGILSGNSILNLVDNYMNLNCQTSTDVENIELCDGIQIENISPNPFSKTSTINLKVSKQMNLKITVLNNLGQFISTLYESNSEIGNHSIPVNLEDYSNGSYYLVFSLDNKTLVRKIYKIN